jgi:Xaa-Pro dipeptidase
MNKEIEEKLDRVIRLIHDHDLGGVLINSQPNFAWLTGGGTNGLDSSREAGVGTLFIRRDGRRFVLANRIELSRLSTEELACQNYEPVEFGWEEERASPAVVAEFARKLAPDNLPLGSDSAFGSSTQVINETISRARYRLTDDEIDRFRRLGKDTGKAIGALARSISPGISELEVARQVIDALSAIGATPVVNLAAADERIQRFRHPVPTDLIWRKTLMIVVCVRRGGLIVSLSRLVCAGEIAEDLIRRTEATAGVNAKMFAATRPGASGGDVFQVAARAYRDAGFPGEEHLHHQGGAVGYRTRDWVAHPGCIETVQDRQAFAWNPSITGTKIEETSIVFGDSIEIITASPEWPSISCSVNGTEYSLPAVLEL